MKPTLLLLAAPFLAHSMETTENDKAITITRDGTTVLVYHKAVVAPPENVDPVFGRSGFIHPLCTPKGEPLTGIQPADHYHHTGLFHAWVKTKHGADEPDFWNIGARTGRVRYAGTESISSEGEPAGFVARQEHVAYKKPEMKELVVLEERLSVEAADSEGLNRIRYGVEQTNISDTTLELPAYRYGGCLAWRGPHDWNKTNSSILTSEGKGRDDSHTTRAKWIAFHGPTAEGRATFALLFDPENHDFPQRLRTWSSNDHNGAPFLSVVPVQEKDWSIPAGETITMNYTLVTADEELDAAAVEKLWKEAYGS